MVDENEVTAAEAEEEAALEASFNAKDVQPEELPDTKADETPAEVEPAADPPATPPLTIEALRDFMEQEKRISQQKHANLAGQMGGIQKENAELRREIEAGRNRITSGISPKAKERLQADFPELAEMLFEGVEAQPAYVAPTPIAAPGPDIEKTMELRLLKKDHRDWEQVVTSQEFADWKSKVLPQQEAATLDDSWDSDFVSSKITDFKKWKSSKKETQDIKKDRLAAAITPKGIPRVGTSSFSDEDENEAMMAAFNASKRH